MEKSFHPIDNSALIHLAVHSRQHSNVFRLEAQLRSAVYPARLQRAVNAAAAQFPMLAAGIRPQAHTFAVVPHTEDLFIRVDSRPMATMPDTELREHAMRVLYGPRHIAVEFFHALTDGTGGMQFLKVLLAEYLGAPAEPAPGKEAWEDSYKKYASGKGSSLPGGRSWLFPAAPQESGIHRTTLTFSADGIRARAKAQNVTVTAFFAALFAQTAMTLQRAEKASDAPLLPVRIMVPIDLRRRFPSASLRNFSLYALPGLTPEAAGCTFPEIAEGMDAQIRAQSSEPCLRTAITTNVMLEQKTAALPLRMKCAVLRAGFGHYGGRSSCITVSNLGPAAFPAQVMQELRRLDFMLTPRAHSPYNCGIVSVGDTLSLTITRRGPEKGVERTFASLLVRQGIVPAVVEDGMPGGSISRQSKGGTV